MTATPLSAHGARRRALAALALAILVLPAAPAASAAPRRIVWFGNEAPGFVDALRGTLRSLGFTEGRDYVLDVVNVRGDKAADEAAARAVVASRPDLVIAGGTPNTLAVQAATSSIPIVTYAVADPVGAGLVRSITRPGGNITGVTNFGPELAQKQLELLRLVVPRATRIAVVIPDGPTTQLYYERIAEVAAQSGVKLTAVHVATMQDVERAFASMKSDRIDGAVFVSNTFAIANRARIAGIANAANIPVIYGYRSQVEAGGLMSYGADPRNLHVVLAGYVDRILRGGKPADMPVQMPADFDLAINVRTAKSLGIAFPREVLARADSRIE
ncbi:MAG: ABC transporter substrate-binding protein [Burkholderiales bacterium]